MIRSISSGSAPSDADPSCLARRSKSRGFRRAAANTANTANSPEGAADAREKGDEKDRVALASPFFVPSRSQKNPDLLSPGGRAPLFFHLNNGKASFADAKGQWPQAVGGRLRFFHAFFT